EICSSRAFGQRLHDIEPIREAVATYAARACEKLRAQGSLCKQVRVSIRTGMFNPNEAKFAKGIICELPFPSDDTRLIIKARSEEHTSELQSRENLVCRLLLEKKKYTRPKCYQ